MVAPTRVTDLSLIKKVDTVSSKVGSDVTFMIKVTNSGPDDASGIVVTDQLPTGYAYASDDGSGAYDSATGLWTIGNLVNGATATLNITATVNASGVYTNVAEITAANESDPDSTPGNHDPTEDDQDQVSTTPRPVIDLSLSKTIDNSAPNAGDVVTFAITVTNSGPSDATGVQVTDLLRSGYTYVGDDGGGAYDSSAGVWSIGSLANGAVTTLHITATVNGGGDYTNVAEVTAANEEDADSTPGNNMPAEDDQDIVYVTPKPVVIAADDVTVAPGVPFTMPITMNNFSAPGIGALTLDVSFDPAVITPTGCGRDPDSLFDTVVCNKQYATGVVRLTFLSINGVSGSHPLANLKFTGNGAAGATTPVTVTIATLTAPDGSGMPFVTTRNGSVTLGVRPGDVNCDDQVNSIDAMFILRYDVGKINASNHCPPPPGYLYQPACDVNGDAQCNSVDALFIMQCEVGIPNVLCPVTLAQEAIPLNQLQTADIVVGEAETARNGLVTIPVTANVADTALGAGTLELHYDPAVLEPTACQADPDSKFTAAYCNADYADGVVRFTLASVDGVGGGMTLANVTFRAIGEPGASSALSASAPTFTNIDGQDIPTTIMDGKATIRALRVYLPITR